jgi:hypothetical protein
MAMDTEQRTKIEEIRALEAQRRQIDERISAVQNDSFAKYTVERPADEPHDKGCQVTRYGDGYCCTCESNGARRRQSIQAAGRAGDYVVLDSLGSMEQYTWHEARKEADPTHKNPYKDR